MQAAWSMDFCNIPGAPYFETSQVEYRMIGKKMQHAIDCMLWHDSELDADPPPVFLDSCEAGMELAALEDAWLSLRMHFEAAPSLEEPAEQSP
jgi:hypothetical protein